ACTPDDNARPGKGPNHIHPLGIEHVMFSLGDHLLNANRSVEKAVRNAGWSFMDAAADVRCCVGANDGPRRGHSQWTIGEGVENADPGPVDGSILGIERLLSGKDTS